MIQPSELVKRLRAAAWRSKPFCDNRHYSCGVEIGDAEDAADCIEALEAENARLKEAYSRLNLTEEQAKSLADGTSVVVPVEPTKAMRDSAYAAHDEYERSATGGWGGLSSAYKAMLKARPQ